MFIKPFSSAFRLLSLEFDVNLGNKDIEVGAYHTVDNEVTALLGVTNHHSEGLGGLISLGLIQLLSLLSRQILSMA